MVVKNYSRANVLKKDLVENRSKIEKYNMKADKKTSRSNTLTFFQAIR